MTKGFSKQMGFEQALEMILITGIADIAGEVVPQFGCCTSKCGGTYAAKVLIYTKGQVH